MQRATGRRAIDGADELSMLGRDALGVAFAGGDLEPLRQRLDRRAVAQVFQMLSRLDPNALLLLLDICQRM